MNRDERHENGVSIRRTAAWFVAVLLLCGCKNEGPAPPTPTGPDPEVARLMNADKASVKSSTSSTFTPTDIIPPPPPVAATTSSTNQDPSSSVEKPAIEVQLVDFDGFHKGIESFKGKIVVIDCWATWCSICKEKFPKFLNLVNQYTDNPDITFVTLANDSADKLDEVKSFLSKSKSSLKTFLLDEDPADFAQHFQVNGVPAYLVYSAEGELIFKTVKLEELTMKLSDLIPPKK